VKVITSLQPSYQKVGRSLSRKQLHKFYPEITQKLEGNENHTNEEKLVNTLSAKTKECNLVTCLVDLSAFSGGS